MKPRWAKVLVLLLASSAHAAQDSSPDDQLVRVDESEAALLEILEDVGAGRLPTAVDKAERLIQQNPKFRLAQLVHADLLMAQDRPMNTFGGAFADNNGGVPALLEEARRRLEHKQSDSRLSPGSLPDQLLHVSESQRHVVVVDASLSRLYLFANNGNQLLLLSDSYVSVGKRGMQKVREGDQRSPIGVYFVTTRLDPRDLSDFYGPAALPINYPNEWDRRLGRTGYGIWFHGVPSDTYSRAPFVSDGCLTLSNSDMEFLSNTVEPESTPVVIADRVNWVASKQLIRQREVLFEQLEQWRQDWESRDIDRYARHYSKSFHNGAYDYVRWLRHKRRVAGQKEFIKIGLDDISIFRYPGERELLVVSFDQDYRSSNFNIRSRKRQYWRRDSDGVWRIVYENRARFLPIHFRGIPYSARAGGKKWNYR